ncbi:hypothetical protein [Bacteroides rodentium]|nr:hypothetical protein [Bacteroides rodentium]
MKPSKPFVMPPVRINLPDIRGAIVNTSQAMELTALLGITIKD